MAWMLSPLGIAVIAVIVVALTTLIYWKRKPIKKWLRRLQMDELKLGPFTLKLKSREKPEAPPPTGVDFGKGNDFTGARIHGVAGRDIRRGVAAAEAPGGKTPGVDFGEKNKFPDGQIEDVAGRDIVEE